MIPRRYKIFTILGIFIILTINVYFIKVIENSISNSKRTSLLSNKINKKKIENSQLNFVNIKPSGIEFIQENIIQWIKLLPTKYFRQNTHFIRIVKQIFLELKISQNINNNNTLRLLNNWVSARQIIPSFSPELGTIIDLLRKSKIIKADTAKIGTQLKLILSFQNGLKAIFKPQWYTRTTKIIGPVYHGKDRHNAEVVAFYLALLLSLRRVPLALIRKLKLIEVQKNATPELLSTIYQKGDNICFYGVCHYCSPADPICGIENILEGSILLWLPQNCKLTKYKHPWKRTYTKKQVAQWEVDMNYCEKVKLSKTYSPKLSSRLLDLIDTAIFDFLIDNGDRHHYELLKSNFPNPAVLLIDNGKSFGNPDVDHIDILAPLYQCCIIHKTTWKQLQLLSGGSLSYSLKKLLTHESFMADVLPIITDTHLKAIDRRLITVYAIVEFCLKKNKNTSNVILV